MDKSVISPRYFNSENHRKDDELFLVDLSICRQLMNPDSNDIKLFFTCSSEKYVADENLLPEHGITHIYEGRLAVNDGEKQIILKPGDTFFGKRNSLFRFTKLASKNEPLKTVAIVFSQPFLLDYYASHTPDLQTGLISDASFGIKPNILWHNYFESLKPCIDFPEQLPEELNRLKQMEGFTLFRSMYAGVDNILSNFKMPDKIDLEAFMLKNYLFNLSMDRFAYLTGRSLSSYKRDFKQIFNEAPQRWLTEKRLQLAHQLITLEKKKPSEVYLQAGFENLSHFSYAFKNKFGLSPSQLFA
jgi:AraC-like DNA-binding protein